MVNFSSLFVVVVLITSLLSFENHKIYLFKAYGSVSFSIFTKLCNHHHDFRTFLSPHKETPYPLVVAPLFLLSLVPSKHESTFCLWICLFWILHINRIIQYMAFCVWRISFSNVSKIYPSYSMCQNLILFIFFWPCSTACGILVPGPGIEPRPRQWKCQVVES